MSLTRSEIFELSYPDFVAYLEQENTPPGADFTLQYWLSEGQISASSYVLDLACTTGYSLRRASQKARCSGLGLDISKQAVIQANAFAKMENLDSVQFIHGDASKLPFRDGLFSHVFGGSNFSFIQERGKALEEVYRVTMPSGFLCVSNYCYTQKPSASMLDEVEKAISFRPSEDWTEDYWFEFLSKRFALFKSQDLSLPLNTDEEINTSINRQLDRNSKNLNNEERAAFQERLFKIRNVLNEHRRYQKIAVQVWIRK